MSGKIPILIFGASLMLFNPVYAAEPDCFELAGRDAKIDPDLLRAIAWHESGLSNAAIGDNALAGFSPGFGFGLMQVDSQHLKFLAQYGIDKESLNSDICTNIYVGTYFLAIAFNRLGDSWEAVGAYNAGFSKRPIQEKRRKDYARRIKLSYSNIKLAESRRVR